VREYRVQLKHALWLMRLSYLCYALKAASDPRALVKKESQKSRVAPSLQVPASRVGVYKRVEDKPLTM
jgi:hypothetical protein